MANIKWTFEKIQEEALKYKTRWEFQQSNRKAYKAAHKRKVLDQICTHMPNKVSMIGENNPAFKWTDQELILEALKYKTRQDFHKNNDKAYRASLNRGLLDQICSHMTYVCYPWTNEEIFQEALKYKTRGEFQQKSNAYQIAQRGGFLDEVCSHMLSPITEIYSDEELMEEALKYKTRGEFQLENGGAYVTARKRKILDKICLHMLPATNTSSSETNLFDTIKILYPKAQKLVDRKGKIEGRSHIHGFDLDIYIPELRKAIEFDGTYHHSFEGLKRGRPHWPDKDLKIYHELKDSYFKTKGIQILHIKEEDWIKDRQACIDQCLEFLSK